MKEESKASGESNEAVMARRDNEIVENKTWRRDIDAIIQLLKPRCTSPERTLALRSLQVGVMWLGMDLKRIHETGPPNVPKTVRQLAQEAYWRYGLVTGFKNFKGDPMPEFMDLPETIQRAWEAAVTVPDASPPYPNSKDPSNTKIDPPADGLKL